MKRIFTFVLSVLMLVSVFAMASCGETGTADITVGAIYIGSQNEPSGYTFAHANGINLAIEALKAEGYNVKFYVQDNVREEDAEVTKAIAGQIVKQVQHQKTLQKEKATPSIF